MPAKAKGIVRSDRLGPTLLLALVALLVLPVALSGWFASGPRNTLVVGLHEGWIAYQPLFLEEARADAPATPVSLKRLVNVSTAQQSFRSGSLDALYGTLDEALRLLAEGVDLRILGIDDSSAGAEAVVARSGISRFEDLKGRRIGLMPVGTDAYVMSRALELHGMGWNDIRIVPLEGDSRISEFQRGTIDAVFTFDPFIADAVHAGGTIVFDTNAIPHESMGVIIAKAETLERHIPEFQALIRLWDRATRRLLQNRSDLIRQIAERRGEDIEDTRYSIDRVRFYTPEESYRMLVGEDPFFTSIAQRMAEAMKRLDLLEQPIDINRLVDRELLRRLYAVVLPR